MMKIEKNETEVNPNYLKKHKNILKSLQATVRNRENLRIDNENNVGFILIFFQIIFSLKDLLKRLQSTLSNYRKDLWEKNHKCIEIYRRNLMSGTSKISFDFINI